MQGSQVYSQIHGEKCWPLVEKHSPCEAACPIGMDVPSYVIAIAQGKFKEALKIIRETNPFPSVCGRVCHHPCEEACTRALVDKPIAIQWLKRLAADMGLKDRPKPVKRKKPQRVAIVGSGPAGLTAAYDLVKKGYGVKVYEALPLPGGMLTAGIPEFNLPKEIALAEIDYIRRLGVDLRTNFALGKDFSLDDLWERGFSSVLLALGSQKSAELGIPGADLKGVYQALPLLRGLKLGQRPEFSGKVVVIGGGNVAMDAARAALRLGARELHIACLEARKDMPAFDWEVEAALMEGAKLHPALAPQQFREAAGGRVGAVDFQRVASTSVDAEGRVSWTLKEGPASCYSMEEVDSVIIAVGQVPEIPTDGRVQLTNRGTLALRADSQATQTPGVFAAGDATVGAGTLVDAIAAGHRASEEIDRFLSGRAPVAVGNSKEVVEVDPESIPDFLIRKPRWNPPTLDPRDAVRCFNEINLGYPSWEGMEEAKRCLNCRMCVNCIFERGQLCFECASRLL